MKLREIIKIACVFLVACCACSGGDADLTIYNQNFAVVREMVPLDLKKGTTEVRLTDMTSSMEPDSVMLRDPQGKRVFRIVEQSYRADPVSQGLLLALNEGKTIDFLVQSAEKTEIVQGKIVRSGYAPTGMNFVQTQYGMQQVGNGQAEQPIIEVEGKLRFQLPGTPLFPPLSDETIVKPTLDWVIQSETAGKVDAEFSYVTGGLNWDAAYNVVAPETGDQLDLVGWVTMRNQTGKTFENARIKLMAGNVNKMQMNTTFEGLPRAMAGGMGGAGFGPGPAVTQKTFDEYHLYELHTPTTLHDKETKQVEFTRAEGVKSDRYHVYDGLKLDASRYAGWGYENIRGTSDYGTQSNPSVYVMREFANTAANHLGIPLPAGRIRFYRRDTDGHLEFTGENVIEHTAADETLHIYTGTAFDLVGERKQTFYRINQQARTVDESFEIKLRNHTKAPVEVRVVEHMYRGLNWNITEHSDTFLQTDSKTAEFRVQVEPSGEKTVTYSVHYTW